MSCTRCPLAAALVVALAVFAAPTAEAQTSGEPPSIDIGFLGVGINVADLARAEEFYTTVFGLERTFQFPPDGDPIEVGLARPGAGMTLVLARLTDEPLPAGKSAYGRIIINTSDARALAERAIAVGSKPLRDIELPGGTIVLFMSDPDGYDFELVQAAPGGGGE